MTATLIYPSYFVDNEIEYKVNTQVDAATLDPVSDPLPGPKYTLKYHSIHVNFNQERRGVITQRDRIHETAKIIGTRRRDLLISALENYPSILAEILSYQNSTVVAYLQVSTGNDQGLIHPNYVNSITNPVIKQIDHGFSLLLQFRRSDNRALDNDFLHQVDELIYNKSSHISVSGTVRIIKDFTIDLGTVQLSDLKERIEFILQSEHGTHNHYQFHLTETRNLPDLSSETAEIIYSDFLICERLVHELALFLADNGVSWSQQERRRYNSSQIHSRITYLQEQFNTCFEYPVTLIQEILEIHSDVNESTAIFLKNNSKTCITEYRILLETVWTRIKSFKYFQGYYLLIVDSSILRQEYGRRYFVVFTEIQKEVYEICKRYGWILAYSDNWTIQDEPAIFVTSGEQGFHGGGWLMREERAHRYESDSSDRLFDWACTLNKNKRYWICHHCKEFVYYHRVKSGFVSCKCGSFDIHELLWSYFYGKITWVRLVKEEMKVIDQWEVINTHYIYFFDYLEELLYIWMTYNKTHTPYIRAAVYGRLAESLPREAIRRQTFIDYAMECGFRTNEYKHWTPKEIHSRFRRLLLEEHFPIDIRYNFNHFIVQNWEF
ncbi:hypothetical protein FO519_009338 [Halicephalobus sp. NKZ332]|nr:hypothetical protein FO519_009338 [Halicephalobus sp. NKZ332]